MAVDITLRWRGALDANVSTNYKIQADKTTPGTFANVVASQAATAPYAPVSGSISGTLAATDTTILLVDGTNFSSADYVTIGREMVQLGTKATNTFTGSTRGIGSTIPAAHANLDAVYKAHESYVDTAVDFGARHVIRYHVIRLQATSESVVSEVLAVNPPIPSTTDMCTVWGILQDLTGDVQAAVDITMSIATAADYLIGTAENIRKVDETTTTDTDGFFSFQVPRSASRAGNVAITITGGGKTWTLAMVPDQNFINVNRVL